MLGIVGLGGRNVNYKPISICGMLLTIAMAVNFMVFTTLYTANLTSLLILNTYNEKCNDIPCFIKNNFKIYVHPDSNKKIYNLYPSLYNQGLAITQDELEKGIQADISSYSMREKVNQVGIKALMNNEIDA